jgi:5'-AMP-activated protein kinase regulatory beta subunit
MKKAAGKKVQFELEAEAGSKVFVAGTFNEWDPTKNPMKDNPNSGKFVTTMLLPAGRHEYKFVVNGEWRVDPKCSEWTPNDCGSLNSVLTVG